MSILTFPSLVGSTWDIKKRQFWSTDIETSASGVEFRTAYWTKPIYEFDMQFSYLSQADMVTLQAFYASMQGPFGTFCLNVPNDGPGFSPAVPVFTGDGSTTSVVLPSAVGYVTNVSAMHQTDWQGRQLLYPTARTNLGNVAPTSNSGSGGTPPTVTSGAIGPDGAASAWRAVFPTQISPGYGVLFLGPSVSTTIGGQTFVVWMRSTDGVSTYNVGMRIGGVANWATQVKPAWTRYVLARPAPSADPSGASLWIRPNNGTSSSADVQIAFWDIEQDTTPGVAIPPLSTVTDYTVSNAGVVTLGQAPASGAVVDADLNYGYLVRFRDDNASTAGAMEINQMLSGFYEQTGLTFRTVR